MIISATWKQKHVYKKPSPHSSAGASAYQLKESEIRRQLKASGVALIWPSILIAVGDSVSALGIECKPINWPYPTSGKSARVFSRWTICSRAVNFSSWFLHPVSLVLFYPVIVLICTVTHYMPWRSVVEAFQFVAFEIREKSYPVPRFRTTFPLRVCNNGTPEKQKSWLQITCASHYQGLRVKE